MRECRYYRIKGRVQGVFFRASTREQALARNLTGWVRNLPDGDVEAVVCGQTAELQAFETWLWQGPEQARVDAVQSEKVQDEGFSGFAVR
ncbi:MAG TPA: acylphosphatase [Gammaproteobacteria bacterium]